MRRKSIWLVLALMVVSLVFALAGCGGEEETPDTTDTTEYKLSETEITLTVDETKKLTISPAPEAAVTWSSDATAVATVKDGTVTAVKAGTANISAAIAGVEKPLTCKVTVKAKAPQGGDDTETTYKLETSSVSIKTTETFQLKVLDGEDKEVTTGVSYASDNAEIATVSQSGLITGVAAGTTAVKVTVGGETLTANVTVAQKYTFTLTPGSLDIAAGAKATLTLNSTPARPEGARPHTFTSSNPAVATVDGGSGEVTGVAKGTAEIICSVEGEEVKATVTVTEYTVKIDGADLTAETAIRVGEEDKAISVMADPSTHAVDATYASSNEQAVTLTEDHKIHAVAAGESDVTVTVGGRTFTTHVTVSSLVQYTLMAGEDEVDEETPLALTIGEEKELTVVRDPEGEVTLTIEISGTEGVLTKNENTITAAKVGTATVKVTVTDEHATTTDPIEFTFTVNVALTTSLTTEDFVFGQKAIDLTYLDTNKTLDWYKYWFNDRGQNKVRMKDNAALLGDYQMASGVNDEEFWDYPVPVIYEDADAEKAFSGNTYGRAVHGSYSIEVKLTSEVTKVILLTGAWKETSVVEFKIGDIVLQSNKIEASTEGDNPPSLARGLTLTIDPTEIPAEGLTLTISVNCVRAHGGNASIVAAAVIGNTAHEHAPTVDTEIVIEKSAAGEFDLTALGNLDWAAVKNGGVYRKAGVPENTIIKANEITYRDPATGTFGADYGNDEGGNAHFTWTDGTEDAPAGLKNFMWSNDFASIPVALTKGNFTVTLFVTGWSSAYMVGVYDANGTFIEGKQVTPTTNQGVTAKVTITLDVKEAGDYTFRVIKLRDSNCGWAAIAVSQNSGYSLETRTFDLIKGDATEHSIVVKKDGETVSQGVSFASSVENVATVAADGKITLGNQSGTTYITVTIGDVKLYASITVTQYTLDTTDNVELVVGGTSKIVITAEPSRDFEATYEIAEGGDTVVSVDKDGTIHAIGGGTTSITVKVGNVTLGTVQVTVASYKLNETEHTIVLASDTKTFQLQILDLANQNQPVASEQITFTSEHQDIAKVETDGTVTGLKTGETKITAEYNDNTFECIVTVCVLPVTTEVIDYPNGTDLTLNLDELDDTNVTLDWHFFRNDNVHEMEGGDLIGDLSMEKTSTFGDYRTHFTWYNGDEKEKASYFGYTDGWTFSGANAEPDTVSVSFEVTLTKDTKYISVFTGAWHAKNTITVCIDDEIHETYFFCNNGGNDSVDKNKQFRIYTDVSEMKAEAAKKVKVTLTVGTEETNGWKDNVSLVAIAVVGNTARAEKNNATASETHSATTGGTDDLTAVGTLDWAYICDDQNGLVTKQGDSHVIGNINCIGGQGGGGDSFANQSFTWSDGTKETSGTNKFKWCDNVQGICVTLTQSAKVTLWISAWQGSVDLTVYDRGTAILNTTRVIQGDGSNSQGVKVEVTLTATEASTFTFLMKKDGGGNFGLGAIAVANVVAE